MIDPQRQICTKCGHYAPCLRSSCVVGSENLSLLKGEREQNLKVLLGLRIRFGVFQAPTHPSLPHDHQDAEDFTSRGWAKRGRLRRQKWDWEEETRKKFGFQPIRIWNHGSPDQF